MSANTNLPSTHKFFTFRYGKLWCANSKPIYNGQLFSCFDINGDSDSNKIFLQPDNEIVNFEFSSTKRSILIQIKDELHIFINLKDHIVIKDIKSAHFSTRHDNHLFFLDNYNSLRIFVIKSKALIHDCEIEDVGNVAVSQKSNVEI